MKKLLMALGAAVLLAGCASSDNNGMGGTSDQDTMKTDSIRSTQNGGSQNNNNSDINNATGSENAPTPGADTPGTSNFTHTPQ